MNRNPLRYLHPKFADWLADLNRQGSPEARQVFIRTTLRFKTNLHIFGRFFFPHVIRGDYDTPPAHLTLIEFLTSPETGAAIFPRGFAKSTWEKIDTIHDIVYALEPVILYISAALSDAQDHFEAIKGELEDNDVLRAIYGNLVPRIGAPGTKWTNKRLQTTNGVNLVARGANKGRGVNINNQRPTKVIVDDGETDEMTHSVRRREKFWRWLNEVIIPSLDKERGRVKMIGTTIHPEAAVLRFFHERGGIFVRAIEDGASIWPDYWPLADLLKLRDGYQNEDGKHVEGIGIRAFSQEYMGEPLNDETTIFKRKDLDANTWEDGELPPIEMLDIVMVVDPNAGKSEMADFMGVVVMGRHRLTNIRYVLHASHHKLPMSSLNPADETQESVIDGLYTKWNPRVLGVERVLNQTALHDYLESRNKYRLEALNPGGKDKVNRAHFTEPHVQQGIIKFHPSHVVLYDELIMFPNATHDDIADAFIYCDSLFSSGGARLNGKKSKNPMLTSGIRNKKF